MNNLLVFATTVRDTSMGTAGLNTLIGLFVVFVALTLIMFVIMLEGKIFTAINNKKAKPKTAAAAPAAPAPAQEPEVEEAADDTELVAVITAAIYAFEAEQGNAVPADGLVVRSIRRRR